MPCGIIIFHSFCHAKIVMYLVLLVLGILIIVISPKNIWCEVHGKAIKMLKDNSEKLFMNKYLAIIEKVSIMNTGQHTVKDVMLR
jgi:hypothetical protein